MKHPAQYHYRDADGVLRFTENKIVRMLLDNGPFDMNQIQMMDFDDGDRQQLAQLIGYSLDGFCDLHYASDANIGHCDMCLSTQEAKENQ